MCLFIQKPTEIGTKMLAFFIFFGIAFYIFYLLSSIKYWGKYLIIYLSNYMYVMMAQIQIAALIIICNQIISNNY